MRLQIIARINTCYPQKFGIPRQSGLVPNACGRLVFEPEFRRAEALRGLEGFSHVWLIWIFDAHTESGWHPTVRPPRLGGNTRLGVFATRAPYRPNPIGLSVVRLEGIEWDAPDGPALLLSGVDMLDGTPILDIKPYVPLADCVPNASAGFTTVPNRRFCVEAPEELRRQFSPEDWALLENTLALDPRPQYQDEPERVYGMVIQGREIKFRVENSTLTILAIGTSREEA